MAKDLGICALIDTYGAVLTEKQRAVLQMYYFEDLSLSEIAELEGISRQGVKSGVRSVAFHICKNSRVKLRTALPLTMMAVSFQWP